MGELRALRERVAGSVQEIEAIKKAGRAAMASPFDSLDRLRTMAFALPVIQVMQGPSRAEHHARALRVMCECLSITARAMEAN